MIVGSSAEWSTAGGNKRGTHESLDDNDGIAMAGPEKWAGLTWVEKHDFLQKKADLLVLITMRKAEAVSQEFFDQRVREING